MGNKTTAASAVKARYRSPVRTMRRRRSARIRDPLLEQLQLDQRQYEGHREERDRQHRGGTLVVVGEDLRVDRVHEDVGVLQGSTLSQQVDLAEGLERHDRADDDREEDGRR